MRLLHTSTLKLVEFPSNAIPPYAILSHTWEEEEVSFQDMQQALRSRVAAKKGFEKIQKCCDIAFSDGFEYAWVDTCCIDKTSSSELSEAINSMWAWYQEAEVCYAYLSDLPYINELQVDPKSLAKSRWFTRGWTLQELIAPRTVVFYSRCWHDIGTKSSLRSVISSITRIHNKALSGASLHDFSIAQRMSWASTRETSRVEDIAYSLMGIFSVNMPMLYGEGPRAFFRLQEEIIKRSDDQSIFAWQLNSALFELSGLLAPSPAAFSASNNIIRASHQAIPDDPISGILSHFSITNKGLLLNLPVKEEAGRLSVLLACGFVDKSDSIINLLLYWNENNSPFRGRATTNSTGLLRRGEYSSLTHTKSYERATYSFRTLYVQTEFGYRKSPWILRPYPSAYLIRTRRFKSQVPLLSIADTEEMIRFHPNISLVYNFHFPSTNLGSFRVQVTPSSEWGRLRVEVSDTSFESASTSQKKGLMTSDGTFSGNIQLGRENASIEAPDRIIRTLSKGTHLLLISIRNKMINDFRNIEIELDICERLSSTYPGSPTSPQTSTSRLTS